MRSWLAILIASLEACVFLLAVYHEPIGGVRGKLRGEAFYQGKPTSYWADEIQQWQQSIGVSIGFAGSSTFYYWQPHSRWPDFIQSQLPKDTEHEWPKLFDGDPEGLPVLRELSTHPSVDVRDWARIGMERIHNGERGPTKHWTRRP